MALLTILRYSESFHSDIFPFAWFEMDNFFKIGVQADCSWISTTLSSDNSIRFIAILQSVTESREYLQETTTYLEHRKASWIDIHY